MSSVTALRSFTSALCPAWESEEIRHAQLDQINQSLKWGLLGDIVTISAAAVGLFELGLSGVWRIWLCSIVMFTLTDIRHRALDLQEPTARQRTWNYTTRMVLLCFPWLGMMLPALLEQSVAGVYCVSVVFLAFNTLGLLMFVVYYPIHLLMFIPCILVTWLAILLVPLGDSFKFMVWGAPLYIIFIFVFCSAQYRVHLQQIKQKLANVKLSKSLDMALARVAQSEHQKTRLFMAATHDIREPFNALALYIEAIPVEAIDRDHRRAWQGVEASIQSCREMLSTLFDYSRIERGRIRYKPVYFELNDILFRIESDVAMQGSMKGLKTRFRHGSSHVFADPLVLEQIVRNLVVNALRYTSAGGVLIAVRQRPSLEGYFLEVWDSGVGLTTDPHRHAADSCEGPVAESIGLGMGLSIVRELVAFIPGARVEFRSKPLRGTLARVFVPGAALSSPSFSVQSPWHSAAAGQPAPG